MTKAQSNSRSAKPNNRQFHQSLIGALAGAGIGETARGMIQNDQVPWWQVLILVLSSLVGGAVIAFAFFEQKLNSTGKGSSRSHD